MRPHISVLWCGRILFLAYTIQCFNKVNDLYIHNMLFLFYSQQLEKTTMSPLYCNELWVMKSVWQRVHSVPKWMPWKSAESLLESPFG